MQTLSEWMSDQPVFFVSTAPLDPQGSVNCSPKGNRDEFAVLDERTVAFLDQTGSGVETIAHLRENGRIVIMLCAFAARRESCACTGRAGSCWPTTLTSKPSPADFPAAPA